MISIPANRPDLIGNVPDFLASKPQKIRTFRFSKEKKTFSLGNTVGILF